MLDAFIIERIRRERESRDSGRLPLRIEVPRHPQQERGPEPREEPEEDRRGVVIVDFTI